MSTATTAPVRQITAITKANAGQIREIAVNAAMAALKAHGIDLVTSGFRFRTNGGKITLELLVAEPAAAIAPVVANLSTMDIQRGMAAAGMTGVQFSDGGVWRNVRILDRKQVNYSFQFVDGPRAGGPSYRAKFRGFRRAE